MDPDSNLEAMREHYAERRRQHERELGEGIARLLGLTPREPEPQAPPLTPGRLREVLGGGPDYAAAEAAEAARLAHVREDALKIAKSDPEDGARFARKWGDHQTAEQIENANREDAAS